MSERLRCLERSLVVPRPVSESFAFFADATNLELITPPWLRFRILTPRPIMMGSGTLVDYRLALHGLPLRWQTRIERWEPDRSFVDTQLRGPFRVWEHTHTFEERSGGTLISDRVLYELPFGPLGAIAHHLAIASDLERIFDYRTAAVGRLFRQLATPEESHRREPGRAAS